MTRIFVQPAPGLLVRKPIGGHLAANGEWQNEDSYWQRRLQDGDVVLVPGAEPQDALAESKPEDKAGDADAMPPVATKAAKK